MITTKESPELPPTATTILLFGDQTDSWVDSLDQLCKQAASTPWLQLFLDKLADVINGEAKAITLGPQLRDSLGHFSSLQELGERYRHSNDEYGVVRALLLHTVRVGTLLQWVKKEPHLLGPSARSRWLGISGGLVSLSALAISEDFDTLFENCLEVSRVLLRLCKLTSMRSRAMEDQPGTWGWAVLGISAEDLRTALDQFQQSAGIPPIKRAKIAVSGPGWHTVIGPPSVLRLFINGCPAVRNLAKNPLDIKALQHTLHTSDTDLDYIVGDNLAFLERPFVCPSNGVWGVDAPEATYGTRRDFLRAVCSQVLSRPLDIVETMARLSSTLEGVDTVRIVQLGPSSHAPYLASVLKAAGREVSAHEDKSVLPSHDSQEAPPSLPGRVAIVGMSGRGPGGDNVDQLWDRIMSQQDLCQQVPKDRFDVDEFYCQEHGRGDKKCTMTTKYGCFMDKPGHFDARFFHISPREAILMDPGHRQFLMSTYEALEMAGYSDGRTKTTDPHRIAAFFGQCTDDWLNASHPTLGCDAYTLQGVQRAFGPGRLAWQFKWEGPTYSLDAACASTTASIHLACMSLMSKEIDVAVAGAANILSYPHSFTCLSKSGVLSDTGNCKPFRDDADGYCRADFVGAVVLKRLEDAIAHNDNILAVVAGSGRNHSGNSTSITTSDADAQGRLFSKVMRNAQVSADDISYVEMHGTGTPVGDPAEMSAVARTFQHRRRVPDRPLMLGGVKGNFGHSEAAAGMAELLKCIMMFQKDTIPPQAGMPHALNPRFPPLADLNFEIPAEPRSFSRLEASGSHNKPRRILLNNFDAAGGNACMVLEDYQKPPVYAARLQKDTLMRNVHVVATSARTQASYTENKRKLVEWLRANPDARMEDVAYTTTARRMHHPFRTAHAAATTQELIAKLEGPDETAGSASPPRGSPVVFVFTGQGSHYAGMGSELYATSPVFREMVDLCVGICENHGFPPFLDLITDNSVDVLHKNTLKTQLAVLTLEISLAAFWQSTGVRPAVVMGHSLGEYAALHVAGVLSLADVLYLVGQRALLLLERCEADTCAMLSVSLSVEEVRALLGSRPQQYASCGVACINSPASTVVSGLADDIAQLQQDLTTQSKRCKLLAVSYGFHSLQMDPMLTDYMACAEGMTYSAPNVPVASTLLGNIVDTAGTFGANYLGQQTRKPVDFVGALRAVKDHLTDPIWLEIGPSAVCGSFVRATLYSPSSPALGILATLEAVGRESPWTSISKCLAAIYTRGVEIDWLGFHAPYESQLRLLTLPSYSWDLKDYWVTYSEANNKAMALSSTSAATSTTKQQYYSTCAQYVVQESSSADHIQVVFAADLDDKGLTALIDGHRMVGEPICPGSVFCEAAIAAATYALSSSDKRKQDTEPGKLAIRNPVMSRPLTKHLVGPDGQLVTSVSTKNSPGSDIYVSWKATPSKGGASYELGTCTLTVCDNTERLQTGWSRMTHFVKKRMEDVVQAARDGHGHRFRPSVFYALFAATVQYDSHYQGVKEAFVSDDFSESVAEVVLQEDPVGTRFVSSPYWGEVSANLAGFTVNANPQNRLEANGTSFINSGFKSYEQAVPFQAGQSYFTYVHATQIDKDTRSCDIFIFDREYQMVAQCDSLGFKRISDAVLGQMLSGNSRSARIQDKGTAKAVQKEQPRVTPVTETEPQRPKENVASATASAAFQVMLESIAKETGMDISDLTDATAPAELGVDSIMAIEVTATVSRATGLDLLPSFLIEHPTIGDLRGALAAMSPSSTPPAELIPSDRVPTSSSSTASHGETSGLSDDFVVVDDLPIPAAPKLDAAAEAKSQTQTQPDRVEDDSPAPSVRMMLLKGGGGASANRPPFFMIADGTGSIGSYIHLPAHITSDVRIYGVDSPYLRCPSRLTVDVGIPGAARLIVEALVKKQPKGLPFWIGGFSGGAMIAYEVARQLSSAGHAVDGLLLIDMCSPRTENVPAKGDLGLAMFDAISRRDKSGVWTMTDITQQHLQALFAAVAAYNPAPLRADERSPARRTAVVWARRGMIERAAGDARLHELLEEQGIPSEAYPGFMEDPRLGAVGWSLAHKTEADLGPNGWDKYVGGAKDAVLCSSIDGDHLDLPTPDYAPLLGEAVDRAFGHFKGDVVT